MSYEMHASLGFLLEHKVMVTIFVPKEAMVAYVNILSWRCSRFGEFTWMRESFGESLKRGK